MSEPESFFVAGVDGCKGGWMIAIIEGKGKRCSFELREMHSVTNFAEVLSATRNCKVVCVDIPIGLRDGPGERTCDKEARKRLGEPRRRSVFRAPIRQCLSAKGYTEANKISLEYSGKGLTPPSFAILDKIRQVDDLMTPQLQYRVREIHPEVLFWALNHKQPMQHKKSRDAGRKERIKVLATIFQNVKGIVTKDNRPKGVKPDDILDALVAAYTSGQVVLNKASTLPAREMKDSKGLRMEIVYPVVDF
jgi:predicted RNase H-like nuclease